MSSTQIKQSKSIKGLILSVPVQHRNHRKNLMAQKMSSYTTVTHCIQAMLHYARHKVNPFQVFLNKCGYIWNAGTSWVQISFVWVNPSEPSAGTYLHTNEFSTTTGGSHLIHTYISHSALWMTHRRVRPTLLEVRVCNPM